MRPLVEPFILSVSGRDRPGILATMAAALAEAGIDIVDIEQATLQDFLALSFLVDLEGDAERSRRLLGDVVPKAAGLGLAVDVRGLDADLVRVLKETDHAVLVLISEKPFSRLIAELGAATARHHANIVSIRRLAEEDLRAGEFVLDVSRVPNLDALKADLLLTAERLGADAGLAREDVYRKSKRVVVFDVDGTLVAGETLDLLAAREGVGAEVAPITRDTMEGRIEFAESLRRRVALLRGLAEIAAREGVTLDQVVGVGDGANDIPMLQAAGLGIAFRAKERTRESAHAQLSRSDFLGLLYLLGVSGRDLNRLRAEGTGGHR